MVDGSTLPTNWPGEVVRQQRAQRHVHVEHREHPLPAPRRQHEAAERDGEGGEEEGERAGVGVLGLEAAGRDLGDEEGEQGGADEEPEPDLHVGDHPGVLRESSRGSPCSTAVIRVMLRGRVGAFEARPLDSGACREPAGPPRGTPRRPGSATVEADDGVGLATVAAGDPRRPGLLLVPGFGGAKEDFADHVDALVGRRAPRGDVRPPGPRRQRQARRPGRLLPRPARGRRPGGGGGRSACATSGSSATRWAGWRCAGPCSQDPALASRLVLMDTSAAPPLGIDPSIAALRRRDRADRRAWRRSSRSRTSSTRSGRRPTSGCWWSARASRSTPTAKWASLSPVMWATLAVEMTTQPDELDALRRGHGADARAGRRAGPRRSSSRRRDLASTIPGAQLVVIPDAGHSPQFENPHAWIDVAPRALSPSSAERLPV